MNAFFYALVFYFRPMGRRGRKRVQLTLENIHLFDAGGKGKAVGKTEEGQIVLVTGAIPGDTVDVRVTKKKKAYMEGKTTNISSFSDKRVEPVCKHFGDCGGCKWQQMDYNQQLFFKQKEVSNNLKFIGKTEPTLTEDILGSENIYNYRNKMEFSFSSKKWLTEEQIKSDEEIDSRNGLGLHIAGAWDKVLHLDECHLQHAPSDEIRKTIYAFAIENDISFFDPREQHGFLRTLMIRTSLSGEIMVLLQFFEDQPKWTESLLDHIADKFPEVTSLLYVINKKGNDTIYDQDVLVFKGEDHINEIMSSYYGDQTLKFRVGPKSFYQTNPAQAFTLYKKALDFGEVTDQDLVFDLYTGTGTIALFLAQQAKKIVGVESVPEAIADAKLNAEINQIDNADFVVGDMKDVFNDDFIAEHGQPDVVFTDPPRDGMHKKVVEQLLKLSPPKIVYVSCNSATQARDIELMKDKYTAEKSCAVDMFPHTHHIENVVLLKLKD
jgi:23S rRNA (uracil1939-C5)-methyltransferase